MLAMGDALALVTSKVKQFEAADFARFHPGGSLGKRLSKVDDVMRPIQNCRVAKESQSVREVYIQQGGQERRSGVVLILNQAEELTGIFTDSDLAKLLEQQQDELFRLPNFGRDDPRSRFRFHQAARRWWRSKRWLAEI